MLAVTTEFQDTSIPVPEYQMFQRKVSKLCDLVQFSRVAQTDHIITLF